ncbi:MAG: hypothetical protein AseanaTS_06980 [Candidatus Pelagadaptatus aseana]|uniref:hypothetical protein n=1 Tax=Candidatus Pelagadaptatus aseana TaxID=3120508 RepID=UPI0039B1CA16
MVEDRININGEFLGISSLAIYSAPWFLQLLLLMLVVALFIIKTSRDSRQLNRLVKKQESDELDDFIADINRAFFGFAVPTKNLAAYWVGFLIYLVTIGYALINTYMHLYG